MMTGGIPMDWKTPAGFLEMSDAQVTKDWVDLGVALFWDTSMKNSPWIDIDG